MTKDEDHALQMTGATARVLGRPASSNPYLSSEMMPRATGETIPEWQAKHDAWLLGWTMEDAIHGP